MVLVISIPKVVPFSIVLIFLNLQNKHCLEARSPDGESNVQRSHFFLVVVVVLFYFNYTSFVLVLLSLELLLPSFIQVNQSLVVENKQDEVQCIRGDADDAEVLQDEVEDVTKVE